MALPIYVPCKTSLAVQQPRRTVWALDAFCPPLQPNTLETCMPPGFVGPTLEQAVHRGAHVRVHPPALQLQHLNAGCECRGRPPLPHCLLGTPPTGLVIAQGHAAGVVRSRSVLHAQWELRAASQQLRRKVTGCGGHSSSWLCCRVSADLDGHAVSVGAQRAVAGWQGCDTPCKGGSLQGAHVWAWQT